MKIAFCFSGQIRNAIQCAPNIKRFIGDIPVDFFIHTWDINKFKNYGMIDGKIPPWRKDLPVISHDIEKLTKEDYNAYIDIYKPKIIRCESDETFNMSYHPAQRMRYPNLYYSWRKSILYCMEYCIQQNFIYDVVIKMRPDVIFPSERRLIEEILIYLEDKSYFYSDNSDEFLIDDIFWIASFENMLKAANYGDPALEMSPSVLFYDYLKFIGIKTKPLSNKGYAPLRPETIQFDVMSEFDKIFYYDQFWYSIKEPMIWLGKN